MKPKLAQQPIHIDVDQHGAGKLRSIGGSEFDNINTWLANSVINSIWIPPGFSPEEGKQLRTNAVQTLMGIAPRDEIEGMLAVQMVAAHAAAMECYRRAMLPEQTFESRNASLAFANKLSRTYANLVEALERKRNGGQQRIIVERIQVAPGGQAIVGNVSQAMGGGVKQNAEGQSHEHATEAGRLAPPTESPLQSNFEADKATMRRTSGTR
jgi:hypothetical protein